MEGPLEGADQPGQWDLAWLSGAAPHSGTTFELVGSVGFALVVNCISLVIADRLPAVTCPIASVGAMALTVYTGQVVAVWALGGSDYDDYGPWVAYVLVSIVFAAVWRGRSPSGDTIGRPRPHRRAGPATSTRARSRRGPCAGGT